MTKAQIIEELHCLSYDASKYESYAYLRRRLSEARYSKRRHYAGWRRIFKQAVAKGKF